MDQAEDLKLIAAWLVDEGCATDTSKEDQLCLLWRALQHTKGCLNKLTNNLAMQRSQHFEEMAEVRKSLEQIRIFTQRKDVLAQEIQDENDMLKDQLRRLICLQDARINEVAKMLYQQGLTELIHSSPSEQVAYLLVERASLLETSEDSTEPKVDESIANLQVTEASGLISSGRQLTQKMAIRQGQSSWRRLFGLHKLSLNKHTFIPAAVRHVADESSGLEKNCSRLERDLEEGSRRLAIAHDEIRRLTGELESAIMTQQTYEAELPSAQQEVEQLRHQVEKLKKYEMVELRKIKEVNDHLDLEIRRLQNRVRCLDAEKTFQQEKVVSLQEEVKYLQSAQQEQLFPAVQVGVQTMKETPEQVEHLMSSLQDHQQQFLVVQTRAQRADDLAKLWDNPHHCGDAPSQLEDAVMMEWHKGNSVEQEDPDYQEAVSSFKKEICETLQCLDKEQSKYFKMRERHRVKLSRAKQKFADMTAWSEEKIKQLERELSLCSHSVLKEKEVVENMNVENEKLLFERSRLLLQLDEEENNKKATQLSSLLSKRRVELLEEENIKLGNQVSHQSNQLAVLQRCLKKLQPHCIAEEVKTTLNHQLIFPLPPGQTSRDFRGDDTLIDRSTSSQRCSLGSLRQSAKMGYLNVTTQSPTNSSSPIVVHTTNTMAI